MRCSKYGSENPVGKKFCEDCGTPLENRSPKCGAETTPGKRFCGECGAAVADVVPAAAADAALVAVSADGERRHLTVLFCDLVAPQRLQSLWALTRIVLKRPPRKGSIRP